MSAVGRLITTIVSATAIVMMAVAFGASSASADELQPDVDALVRLVHAAPTLAPEPISATVGDITFDGIRFGAGGPFRRVRAGDRPATMRTASGTVASGTLHLKAGCLHTVVTAQPDGLRRPARLLDMAECGIERMGPAKASIRLINATADNGAVVLAAGGNTATAPFTASTRVEVPAGRFEVLLRSPATGETLAKSSFSLDEGSAYTLAYLGGGEAPLRLAGPFLDGVQPPRPPDPRVPINTEGPEAADPSGMPLVIMFVVVMVIMTVMTVCTFGVKKGWPWHSMYMRSVAFAVVAGLAATACAAPTGSAGVQPHPTAGYPLPTRPTPPATPTPSADIGAPARLVIAAAAVDASVVPVPSESAAKLPAHLDGDHVGWFDGTTRPGNVGVAVLAGHVVYSGRDAVFAHLDDLHVGDTVMVKDDGPEAVRFTVRAVYRWTKAALPESAYAPTPERTVVLVTCSRMPGVDAGPYTENLVVVAAA